MRRRGRTCQSPARHRQSVSITAPIEDATRGSSLSDCLTACRPSRVPLCLEPSDSGQLRWSGRTAGRSESTVWEIDQRRSHCFGFIKTVSQQRLLKTWVSCVLNDLNAVAPVCATATVSGYLYCSLLRFCDISLQQYDVRILVTATLLTPW